jgi:sulfur-oxidizing protein SoxZ
MGVANMATDAMRIRAQISGERTEIKVLMSHPMETGRKKNDFGDVIPAHFIQSVIVAINEKPVMEAQWGTGISKNPYLVLHVRGAKKGDQVEIRWLDNLGQTGTGKTTISDE